MELGDIVIVTDEEAPRNRWSLGRVINTEKDEDGLVRKVKVALGDRRITKQGRREKPLTELERPIHKLIYLTRSERPGVPVEEPCNDQ